MTDKNNDKPHSIYLKSLGKKYKDMTKEEFLEYNRHRAKYNYVNNKESILKYHREYHIENKDMLSRRAKRYYDHNKLSHWFRQVKYRTGDKGAFNEVVGCTEEELTTYIMSMFQEGMSWDNWGRGKGADAWHIDHIVAVKDGGSNHYTNLQPLWCIDNLRKANCK